MVKCKRNARSHQVASSITQVLATYEIATSILPLATYELLQFFKDEHKNLELNLKVLACSGIDSSTSF